MRFIHTSDWHLGRRLHRVDLLDDQAAFLTWLLQCAVEREVDAVVVAGDVYDRSQPPVEAVQLLDDTISAFASARIPLLLTAGNHDSAVRLGYGRRALAGSGIHVRAERTSVTDPLVLEDAHGAVGFYGIPYLHPDLVNDDLGAARSHESVLGALAKAITDDAAERRLTRTVVAAHAFVTGGTTSESERDISVGGVADCPADVFHGFSYVALGHLHGPQRVTLSDSATVIRYSGSPLAFSFSERAHTKSVTLVDLDGAGRVSSETIPVPVRRPLRQRSGRLDDLLADGRAETNDQRDHWMKFVLTDPVRPQQPLDRLRTIWPNTLLLEFAPDGHAAAGSDPAALRTITDPVTITTRFYEELTGAAPDEQRRDLIRSAVERTGQGVA